MTAAVLQRRTAAYGAILRIGFLEPLAYRLFPFMMLVSYPIILTGNYFLYSALYASRGGSPIAGLTADQAITYMLVAWTVRSFYKNPISRIIGERVKSGAIASDLIKPINFFGLYLMQGLGRGCHRIAFVSIPLAVLIIFSGRVQLPQTAEVWAMFICAAFGGFLLNYTLSYLVGLLAFVFEYNDGLDWMIDLCTKLLGGLMLPLTFFPDWALEILKLLPFAGMYYQPAAIFLGQSSGMAAWQALGLQWVWIGILALTGQLLLWFGHRKLLVQGG